MQVTVPANALAVIKGCSFHVPGFLESKDADRLSVALVEETFPRWVLQLTYNKGWPARIDKGHTMARFDAPGVTYTYKGKPKPMFPFTPAIRQALASVDRALGTSFNCVVINSYEPSSGLYPHRDGHYIPQLGNKPVIAALSFGCARTFLLHPADPKTNKRIRGATAIDVQLGHGDLFVMYGDCDVMFHHSIPEEPTRQGTRVSLTFRQHNS